MRYFMPDPSEFTGGNTHEQPLDTIPTGMEKDPHADEEVIDNHSMEEYPEPMQPSGESAKIAPDDLADSIAYALDGSGPGPINATPTVSGHSGISEETAGLGLEGEERIAG